jgi:PDZ domain-containing protein
MAVPEGGKSGNVRKSLVAAIPAVVLGVCLFAVQLPLFAVGPGPAQDVLPRIEVEATATYQPDGRLLFTTVNVGRVNAFDALAAWWADEYEVVGEHEIVPPGQTDREYDRRSRSQMDESVIAAISAALGSVSEYPEEHGPGVVVQGAVGGSPAAGRLFGGDHIIRADGEAVDDLAELRTLIRAAGTERPIRLEVAPVEGGDRRVERIRPTLEEGDPVIGIVGVEGFPFPIRIDTGSIGGPSAGLMWAVGLADLLTPGDLLAGRTVAGTGAISAGGTVGGVGGVGHKVLAAEREGADAFLVPEGDMTEAQAVGADVELVSVRTLDDALAYLERAP